MHKIIIADDSRKARTIIAEAVAAYKPNIEICEVENGKEFVERVGKERFDLAIIDHLMPIMTGLEAITEIRNLYSKEKLPICMLTALDIKEEADRIFKKLAKKNPKQLMIIDKKIAEI